MTQIIHQAQPASKRLLRNVNLQLDVIMRTPSIQIVCGFTLLVCVHYSIATADKPPISLAEEFRILRFHYRDNPAMLKQLRLQQEIETNKALQVRENSSRKGQTRNISPDANTNRDTVEKNRHNSAEVPEDANSKTQKNPQELKGIELWYKIWEEHLRIKKQFKRRFKFSRRAFAVSTFKCLGVLGSPV